MAEGECWCRVLVLGREGGAGAGRRDLFVTHRNSALTLERVNV